MITSTNGLDLIKSFEGLELTAYLCPAKIPTIGYGHTKTVTKADVTNKKTITKEKADELLRDDLKEFENKMNVLVKTKINSNQFDAMISLMYNIGSNAFANSTLLRKLNNNDFEGAANEFKRWNKAGGKVLNGLTRRRKAEEELFRK